MVMLRALLDIPIRMILTFVLWFLLLIESEGATSIRKYSERVFGYRFPQETAQPISNPSK
ncbi:hypothetical protein TSA1_14990 [Bradyrhizobium nitroreducens]|uniref:Uncharacterized protein n=1 Tax=Bradyrhizobium nitroreducens TaxID=709803 RepID=A0A2M6UBH9_9BRAD|nr:hypothetical protein TSA1_14990 [Bradyrhizobium nitroreducens]